MADAAETSFSNNFWSHDETGLRILVGRMHNAKQTCEEVKAFYKERVALEEDYSKRLAALSKRPLGSSEGGTLKDSLESIRRETEAMGLAHSQAATHMKGNLEDPFIAFANGIRERRKTTEATIEKLSKARMTQWHNLEKSQERYEGECNKIKACIAQGNLLIGKDYDKNRFRLEKLQVNVEISKREYQTCLRVFQETAERWKSEWRLACDRFQDLEEERIDFLKASFWNYTNIASIACVSDDECCENIRLSLEKCDLMADINSFVATNATGQRIPEPPGFINFMDGDFSEDPKGDSEISNFERSSTAQLHAFSKTGPTKGSNYNNNNTRDPDQDLAIIEPSSIDNGIETQSIPSPLTREALDALHKSMSQQSLHQQERTRTNKEGANSGNENVYSGYAFENVSIRPPPQAKSNSSNTSPIPPLSSPEQGYESSLYSQPTTISNGDLDTPAIEKSKRNNNCSPQRNGRSRPQSSDIENYVCVSPFERRRGNTFRSETSPSSDRAASPIKGFGDHLRNTSLRKMEHQESPPKSSGQSTPTRNHYHNSSTNNSYEDKVQRPPSRSANFLARTESGGTYNSPSRSNTQPQEVLNIGANMFPVRDARPDPRYQEASGVSSSSNSELTRRDDPLSEALRALKGDIPNQQSTKPTSAPSSTMVTPRTSPNKLRGQTAQMSSPTAYVESPTRGYGGNDDRSTRHVYQTRPAPQSHRQVVDNYGKGPANRPVEADLPYQMARVGVSPDPVEAREQHMPMDNRERMMKPQQGSQQPMMPGSNSTGNIHNRHAPNEGQFEGQNNRMMMMQQSKSYGGGELDQARRYKGENVGMAEDYNRIPRQPQQRTNSHDFAHAKRRSRSAVDPRRKPMAASAMVDQVPKHSSDGRPIIRHVQALYDYKAAIPEEIGFRRGDILSVLRMQQDGWWEVEVLGAPGRIGLAPSNFTRPI